MGEARVRLDPVLRLELSRRPKTVGAAGFDGRCLRRFGGRGHRPRVGRARHRAASFGDAAWIRWRRQGGRCRWRLRRERRDRLGRPSGTWSFTPAGRAATSITVPGGGWYKQGFTDVNEAVYSRSITVPDSGQPQSTWIEFGAVNHQATLSVDGRVVATQTTAFTPSNFDISAYAAPGTTHTISGGREGPRRVEGIQRPVPGARRRRVVRGGPAGHLPFGVPAGVPGGVRQRHVRPYVGGEPDAQLRRVGDVTPRAAPGR